MDSQCPCCKNPWTKKPDADEFSCVQCDTAEKPKPAPNIEARLAKFAPITLGSSNLEALPASERTVLQKLIAASRELEAVYLKQKWAGTTELLASLPQGSDVAKFAAINKGPWCELDRDCFVPPELYAGGPIPHEPPPNANLYPDDMTKAEFEAWAGSCSPEDAAAARGFFHVIRRGGEDGKQLCAVPYAQEYSAELGRAAALLEEAAAATTSSSLAGFLRARAAAFVSNDYAPSDVLWLGLDSDVHVTIGPYEVYMDEMFGQKATFESFVGIRDKDATSQLEVFQGELTELEVNLPCEEKFKSPDSIKPAAIRVVDLLFAAGDVAGPLTLAFCLPNDEGVRRDHGTALIMLRNVSEAKFTQIMLPMGRAMVKESLLQHVTFQAFYTHTLCHECCHAIGPHDLAEGVTVRSVMQDLHSALEEAKADAVGLWATHYLMDKGLITGLTPEALYVSYLVGALRTLRFGHAEAHGKGMALQLGLLMADGVVSWDGALLDVQLEKMRDAVARMAKVILEAQGEGDKASAEAIVDGAIAEVPASLFEALQALSSVPVDVTPSWSVLDS